MNNQILFSAGPLLGRPYTETCRLIRCCKDKLHCDGFELMISSGWYDQTDDIIRELAAANANFQSTHFDKWIGELLSRDEDGDREEAFNRFKINCKIAKQLGITLAVLHLWGGLPSDRHIEDNLAALPELVEIADQNGITLTVENIVCNQKDPLTHMIRLAELYPDTIKFTIDTRQAAFHGLLEQTMTAPVLTPNRLSHVHISDFGGNPMEWEKLRQALPIGEGNTDFEPFFDNLRARNYEGKITLESYITCETDESIEKANQNLDYIRNHM